jgi:hypothetical protein
MKKYSKITLFFSIIFILLFIYLGYYFLKKEFHLDATPSPPVAEYQKTPEEITDERQIQYKLEYTVNKGMIQIIHLNKDSVLFKMEHFGDSDFVVTLKTTEGELIDTLANEKGKYNGTKALIINETGPYILDVVTNGNWRLSFM